MIFISFLSQSMTFIFMFHDHLLHVSWYQREKWKVILSLTHADEEASIRPFHLLIYHQNDCILYLHCILNSDSFACRPRKSFKWKLTNFNLPSFGMAKTSALLRESSNDRTKYASLTFQEICIFLLQDSFVLKQKNDRQIGCYIHCSIWQKWLSSMCCSYPWNRLCA